MDQFYLALFLYFLLSSSFFSGAEAAFLSFDRVTLNRFKSSSKWFDKQIAFFLRHFDLFIISILFFNLFNNTMAVWTAREWIQLAYPSINLNEGLDGTLFTFALTAVILIFCEINPKRIGMKYNRVIAYFSVFPMTPIYFLLLPFSSITRYFTRLLVSRMGETSPSGQLDKNEFLVYVKKSKETGALKKVESEILQNLITYKDLQVKSVLIPRYKVDGFNISDLPENLEQAIKKFPYNTIPVYENLKDNIVGVISKRKLFFKENGLGVSPQNFSRYLDAPRIVPETKELIEVLADMDQMGHEICLVTDEYGGLEGIATYVDIINKLLGKSEQSENDLKEIQMIKPGIYSVKADVSLSDFNDYFKTAIVCETAETIGGYLIEDNHNIPRPGEKFELVGLQFKVKSATRRRIGRIEVRKIK